MRSLLPHRNRQLACHALLLAVCLVGYWPLTLGVFSVKNDAIHYFLPARYNISCAIRSGEWPLWSPFFYTGFPLHGDMQSGAWNPLVWVLSLFSRYNLTVLHIETLLYIYLAGIGMFRLARQVTSHTGTRLFVALSYMLSGYLFGSAQFTNWMASAAFLPFVLDSYTDLLRTRTTGSAVRTALSCWMLLVCGYPADFLYTSYLLLALLAVVWVHHRNRLSREAVRRYAVSHLVLIALFIGLALPALLSYIQMLPYYGRGGGASLQDALVNSYEPRNLVSLLDPWPTWTAGFRTITDLSSRNLFVGVLPLLFLPFAFGNRMRKRAWLLLGILLISLLFAFGDGFGLRRVAYSWLPGMASFRHPAHFRLYVIVALLLLSASGFDHLRRKSTASFRKSVLAGLVACLVIMVLGGAGASGASLPAMSRAALKSWVVNVSMGNALVVGLACQALFLLVVFLYARRRAWSPDRLLWLHVANLLFFNALLPVTLVGKTNPSVVNGIIRARAGVTSGPSFDSTLSVNSRDALAHYETAGRLGFYSGRITLLPTVYNPSALRT
ncbi:MAG: putative rane protein, partial [Flaviaesturariibacter sp.]|nr:putative rane protein [Flaviaesturariibacter sp.]